MKCSLRDSKIRNSADRIKKDIVVWLLHGGMSFNPKQDAIANEVLFSQSRRRADLLILSDVFHALEIKGDSDTLTKLPNQIEDYRKAFDLVSVVVTNKHLDKVKATLSKSVGIILIENAKLSIVRAPRLNKKLDKATLLMFFNKKMLSELIEKKGHSYFTDELRQLVKMKHSLGVIRERAYQHLKEIYNPIFRRFYRESEGYPIQIDEIRSLSADVSFFRRFSRPSAEALREG